MVWLFRWIDRWVIRGEAWAAAYDQLAEKWPAAAEVLDRLRKRLGAIITVGFGIVIATIGYIEGAVAPWGTLGYVVAALTVALLLALVLLALAVVFAACARGLYWLRMSHADAATAPPGQASAVPENSERPAEPEQAVNDDEEARHDLTLFVTDYVMPACTTQLHLQEMIIKHSYVNDALARLATQSIIRSDELSKFGERFEYLSVKLCSSPMGYVPFERLKDCVLVMDKTYGRLCAQADALAAGAGFECQAHHTLAPLWEEWRQCHNRLVDAYRSIKRDRRFAPELYRPGINGPWTKPIPPFNPA